MVVRLCVLLSTGLQHDNVPDGRAAIMSCLVKPEGAPVGMGGVKSRSVCALRSVLSLACD